MKFTKMHGLGNDYVYVNCLQVQITNPSDLARAVSDRHKGIGSDGLILLKPSTTAHVRMEMYNADGSRGVMCGNGLRCVAKYAVEHGLATGPDVRIEADEGVKRATCKMHDGVVQSVQVDMGQPSLAAATIPTTIECDPVVEYPLSVGGLDYLVTCVSMGNPHAIVFVDDLDSIPLVCVGPKFERAPQFPQRINTHFVRVDSTHRVTMKSWERGSGATQACGTGACAVCVAGVVTERTERRITATLPGGDLDLQWAHDDHVYMTGPAVEVFTGCWPVPS